MPDPAAITTITTTATTFLTTMAAMSTAVQTFIDHAIKGRWKWLDTATPNEPKNEGRRQSAVHLISFIVGASLGASLGIEPLSYLGAHSLPDAQPLRVLVNALATGLMVSFGSSFFNEALDGVRAFKKAQEGVRQTQLADGTNTPNTLS